MRNIFSSSSPSTSVTSSPIMPPLSPNHTVSESIWEEKIEAAQSIISKWDSEASVYAEVTSLFHDNRSEGKEFLKSVIDLQTAMNFFASDSLSFQRLASAQSLMQIAMRRLEKEFFQILAANRNYLDDESVSSRSSLTSPGSSHNLSDFDDDEALGDNEARHELTSDFMTISPVVMSDLKAIADCMISTGYGEECVQIYKNVRKSILEEALHRLGVERLSFSQIQKLDWEVTETKIKNWLYAVKFAMKTVFYGERILCDHVFYSSVAVREACFGDISKHGAIKLFSFPELIAKCKKTPEKMFRTLDLYESISDFWPEIESIFSYETTKAVRSQALTSLARLGDAVRTMLSDFETAIQNDASKSQAPGGGVHPLTRYVMNYISFLTDYSDILSDIIADLPLPMQTTLPETYFHSLDSNDNPTTPISIRFAWIILVLLCKLDTKAELYSEVSLSYIFLANNLQYIVRKVQNSHLHHLLGQEWLSNHENKVRQYAMNYERVSWKNVFESLPENPTIVISPTESKDRFKRFNAAFEELYRKQTSWIVTDPKLRDDIKVSVAMKLVPAYRAFYEKNRDRLRREMGSECVVRFAPDDLGNYLSDLFYGTDVSGSVVSSPSSSHTKKWWSR